MTSFDDEGPPSPPPSPHFSPPPASPNPSQVLDRPDASSSNYILKPFHWSSDLAPKHAYGIASSCNRPPPKKCSLKVKTLGESLLHERAEAKDRGVSDDGSQEEGNTSDASRSESQIPASYFMGEKVRFTDISVREYDTVSDIKPGVTSSPDVSIGWMYRQSLPLTIDEYEKDRPPRARYDREDWCLLEEEQQEMLLASGYTKKDVEKATFKTNFAQTARHRTKQNLDGNLQRSQEAAEEVAVKIQRFLHLRRTSVQGRDQLWKDAQKRKGEKNRKKGEEKRSLFSSKLPIPFAKSWKKSQ